ncbi:hypothetical protein GC173_00200 [bacterium]|nr:hypothetical protein [bacterium]
MDDGCAEDALKRRLRRPAAGRLDAVTRLRHFALINYAVPAVRLRPHIPGDLFEIEEFPIGGRPMALLSIVPFVDKDFRFPGLLPGLSWRFAQTNHRVYVRHRRTGEKSVWFLGTTLGHWSVAIPRTLWSMPWYRARYRVDCQYSRLEGRYRHWSFEADSDWASLRYDLQDTGEPVRSMEGFRSRAEFLLTMTNPVTGYFKRLDGRLGRYSIWHPLMTRLTRASVKSAWCGLYERLEIMSREELARPHSAFLLPQVTFQVSLPPTIAE